MTYRRPGIGGIPPPGLQAADLVKAWHLDDNGPAVVDFAETLPPAACRTERRTAPVRRASMMG